MQEENKLSSILYSLGENHADYFNAVAPPIMQTSNFLFEKVEDLQEAFKNEYDHFVYSRGTNPTLSMLRQKLAALDGAEDALIVNSGASAIFNSVVSFVKQGDHIVSVNKPYTWAQKLFDNFLSDYGVTTTYIDGASIENWLNATTDATRIYYLESPNSWTYELQDLEKIAALAGKKGILTIIDNSYCTPLYQQPIKMGIDISIQSATKYLGGHSDVVAGVIAGKKAHLKRIFDRELMTAGNGTSPFNAWLLMRGLRTLPLRLERSSKTTRVICTWLNEQTWIERVIFPFLEDFPQYELAKKQMAGACGLLTIIVLSDGFDKIAAFVEALKTFRMAVSWGGYESLVIPRISGIPKDAFDPKDENHRMIRLYLGLEDPEYLIHDLQQASVLLQDR